MDQKNTLLLFTIISAFILLSWICLFNIDLSDYYKTSERNYKNNRKLDKNYRLLAISKEDKCSVFVRLNEKVPNYAVSENKDVYYNEKEPKRKMKHINGKPFMNAGGNQQNMRNKKCIFETKKYSRMEKKIFKELDYMDFLKNNRTICNKIYVKTICKKYRLRFVLPLLLMTVLLILYILDLFVRCGIRGVLFKVLNLCGITNWYNDLSVLLKNSPVSWLFRTMDKVPKALEKITRKKGGEILKTEKIAGYVYVDSFFNYLLYVIPLLILGVIIILGLFYYHKKVKKYQKIKFKKR
ncbi:fam-l protein [Plasmodium malariae]|uniref:Fam-l protein n=1 Tax=Plasmodium malariae TaxID=5858 RepID=A0A1D3JHR4_PLAMA|nr:fam-l protein [Plasmodium malariae]SBT85936.1 fam-l protein [Plasmodium malariae]